MFQINFVNYSNQCSASEPELSLITFIGSDSISASSSRFTVTEIPDKGKKKCREGGVILGRRIFQIFQSKWSDYSRKLINRGTAIIRESTGI